MEVTETTTRTIKIKGAKALDEITVMIQDYEPGKGEILIKCYGESWTAYWGGMGGDDIITFFLRANNHYLMTKLAPNINPHVLKEGQEFNNPHGEELEYEPNKKWGYVSRIIDAVKEAFKQINEPVTV